MIRANRFARIALRIARATKNGHRTPKFSLLQHEATSWDLHTKGLARVFGKTATLENASMYKKATASSGFYYGPPTFEGGQYNVLSELQNHLNLHSPVWVGPQ